MVVVTNEPFSETEPLYWSAPRKDDVCRTPRMEQAYRNITSSMQAETLEISSPVLALDLLITAVKVRNIPVVRKCVEVINGQLDARNVMSVMLRLLECSTQKEENYEPSAPPISENKNTDCVEVLVNDLIHSCNLVIDKNADIVLKDPDFPKLPYKTVLGITSRDSLQVSNEILVYRVIIKWGQAECCRKNLQPHSTNLKAVLRDLIHSPRYGLMVKTEFLSKKIDGDKGPTKSGILEEKEWRHILFYIKEKSRNRPVEELPHRASRPRCISYKIQQSSESATEYPNKNLNFSNNRCDRIFLNLITCWSAVFD